LFSKKGRAPNFAVQNSGADQSTAGIKFAKEFLAASAIFVLCLLWIFRTPILTGQVAAFDAQPQSTDALLHLQESVYEVEPALVTQSRILKDGFFPSWSPYSAGGNPLIGKMQNGVFAPEHLLLYIFPLAAIPYLFMLIVALKFYLAFIFTYLYSRCLRLNLFSGIFAGIIYVFSEMVTGGLLSWSGTAPYLPLLLLLVESYFRGHRRLAQMLLPWAVAFAFFSGHFESAFYICLITGLYFLARLWNTRTTTWNGNFAEFIGFIVPASVGAILAGVQIAPAYEYVQNSFNKAWHDSSVYVPRDFQTISKHLSMEDAPVLGVGIAGILIFIFTLKRYFKIREKPLMEQLLPLVITAISLAVAVACLSNLGLDDSLSPLVSCGNTADLLGWVVGFFLLFLSIWIWRDNDQHIGIKVLGGILIGSMAFMLKLPVLSNILLHLPFFKNFHNAGYRCWSFQLSVGILCAAAFERIEVIVRSPRQQRLETALRAACVLGVFLGGYLLSQPLKGIIARLIPAGVDVEQQPIPTAGGIISTQQIIYNRTQTIVGWAPASLASSPLSSVVVELVEPGHQLSLNSTKAIVSPGSERSYFHAIVPVPPQPDTTRAPAAIVTYADGTQKLLAGTPSEIKIRGRSQASGWLLVGALFAFPLIFLCGPVVPRRAGLLLLFWMMWQCPSSAIPASQRPYHLGGIDKIRGDKELLRIDSLQHNFLMPDYSNVYGLSDIRSGGDNIDVLSHIYFFQAAAYLMANKSDLTGWDYHSTQLGTYGNGLRLLGLANVKYLIDFPNSTVQHPGLEPIYRGEDMTVFKNKYFGPRAAFYDQFTYLPMGDWTDFKQKEKFLTPLYNTFQQGMFFNDKNYLLMNEKFTEPFMPSANTGPAVSSVQIKDYSPDKIRIDVVADRPGAIFLADTLFPGWVAFRNGVEVPIFRSWLTFRAVQVGEGKSVVEFLYRPVVLLTALSISVAISLGWVILYYRYKFGYLSLNSTPSPAAVKNKKQKKIVVPEPMKATDEDAVIIGLCSASAEWIEGALIAATLLYWTVWAALRYKGGIQHGWNGDGWEINIAACALLVAGVATLLGDLRKRVATKP
jgi:hypothetical protein